MDINMVVPRRFYLIIPAFCEIESRLIGRGLQHNFVDVKDEMFGGDDYPLETTFLPYLRRFMTYLQGQPDKELGCPLQLAALSDPIVDYFISHEYYVGRRLRRFRNDGLWYEQDIIFAPQIGLDAINDRIAFREYKKRVTNYYGQKAKDFCQKEGLTLR